ncbi:MAG: hypothetical protein CL786_00025 [Chloroflexi bacterium]|nr:hypothetical protein [Chloroflexota bacterium]|tara:strand:- start:1093 stop:1434 length:342 start_codon:yes stop_codon:yes gene_type:complete
MSDSSNEPEMDTCTECNSTIRADSWFCTNCGVNFAEFPEPAEPSTFAKVARGVSLTVGLFGIIPGIAMVVIGAFIMMTGGVEGGWIGFLLIIPGVFLCLIGAIALLIWSSTSR